ncbi:hypothetical protein EV174_004077 [Coemansia sp. RSA 2320]|nr:hypothetical protein EV174_004077 [Coemansia sp. RSA 2320]
MSGPTNSFDPFGSSAALPGADDKTHAASSSSANDSSSIRRLGSTQEAQVVASAGQFPALAESALPATTAAADTTVPVATVAAAHMGMATATAATTAAPLINPAVAKQTEGHSVRHTSIFEIGGEPFSEHSPAAPTSRLSRIVGAANGSSLSSTTPQISTHPLGSIMGSPHSLFNESTYGPGQPHLPLVACRPGQATSHRLSQSRFNGVLGDSALHSSGSARSGDKDASGGQGILDMSNGILDTIKSQQASPSTMAQGAFNEFYVKSLPVSRRSSLEYQNLWQELEGFSINDNSARPAGATGGLPSHLPTLDGHSVAARNSSSAFRSDPAALGTSPKLPHGLLDDDGVGNSSGARISALGSAVDLAQNALYPESGPSGTSAAVTHGIPGTFALGQASYVGYSRDPRLPSGVPNSSAVSAAPGGQPQQRLLNGDVLHADAAQDLRLYDPGRSISLTRNSSTPMLNARQYHAMQGSDDIAQMPGHARGGHSTGVFADQGALPRFDSPGPMYTPHYQGYPATAGDLAYDLGGGGRLLNGGASNYPYAAAAPSMNLGRNHSFVGGGSVSGTSTPMIGMYGPQSSFGHAAVGMYGMGHQTAPPSMPPTSMQHAHHGASHIHMHMQPLQAQQQQQKQQLQSQRHVQQQTQPPPVSMGPPSAPASATASVQSQSMHGQQKGSSTKVNRRGDTEVNRFINATLEELKGTIFDVCKDQYGCRFLQKKLEDGQEDQIELIFIEVLPHSSSLMTDPFGNYLCQKLLEHCNVKQRTQIIAGVAPDLASISLNMHGTRAVQKIIELLSTQEQIDLIIGALRGSVVQLIRDLNGNHVIQKCLSRLSSKNNQFIYDSVSSSCSDVATHRHGCCVFQRCIDYAADQQKGQLVNVVISQALKLVQDPFGNYVVQYVLDLNVMDFSEPLIRMFVGHICGLSVQKFSSNVMEKCIRIASPATRKMLVAPLLQREKLDMLMRDSYGNYVVQTALDFADQQQRADIIEAILPLLPLIRHTPFGKRIYIKLQRDGYVSAVPSAAGSRHASPTLGPSHGSHSTTAMSAMSLYPQMGNSAIAASAAGSSGSATAAGANLSRGVSPSAGAGKAPLGPPRSYAPPGNSRSAASFDSVNHPNASGVFQQQQQPHMGGGMYLFRMASMDAGGAGAAAHMYHAGMPMMAPAHPGSMASGAVHGVFEHPAMAPTGGTPITVSSAPSSAAGGPASGKLHASAYYGAH